MKAYRSYLIGIGIFIAVIILMLLVKVRYSIKTMGKMVPSREWILQRTNDGSLMATLADHRNGLVQDYSVIQIERGDATRFQLSPLLNEKQYVAELDTIGSIHSYEVLRQLTELEGDLAVAKATLKTQLVGEKEAVIQEARQQHVLAQERAELQNRLFLRQDSLFHQNLVSQEEYEMARSEAKIAEIEADIAEVQLQSVTTGVKPEQIEMVESRIRSLENDVRLRKSQLQAFTLRTPIAGKLFRSFSSDTLLSVCDTSYLLIMPVQWGYHSELIPGQMVSLKGADRSTRLSARIVRIEDSVKILNRDQIFFAVASIEGVHSSMVPDLIVPCTIRGRSLSLVQVCIRMLESILNE
jgi:hypothetical protein